MMLRSLQNLLLSSPTQAVDNNARDNNSLNFFSLNKHRENEHVKARVPTTSKINSTVQASNDSQQQNSIADSFKVKLKGWYHRLNKKIFCFHTRKINAFFYHFRKSGGTSLKKFISSVSSSSRSVPSFQLFETEGKTLNIDILETNLLLTFVVMRHPIERIRSLYWYEHVDWFYKIVQDKSKVRTYREWAEAWLDGSEWKRSFVAANPGNNYMEIDNYYVKALIGWNRESGNGQIGEAELEKAKEVLQKFDVVLITEWLRTGEQADMLDTFFQKGPTSIRQTLEQRGDLDMRTSLYPFFAPDEKEVEKLLTKRNELDIRLYEFAQDLVRIQMKEMLRTSILQRGHPSYMCPHFQHLPRHFAQEFGLFKPPEHKGPY